MIFLAKKLTKFVFTVIKVIKFQISSSYTTKMNRVKFLWTIFFLVIIRVSEPEPGGSETLRHPVDILLLELMKAYIF